MDKYVPCECGEVKFNTTKTEFYDVTVEITPNGSLKDTDDQVFATHQPDKPYGIFVCQNCGKNYETLPEGGRKCS